MADYLFVPQSVLDRWSEQGRVQVDGNVLTILSDGKSFALTPAVRFLKMEAGEDTAHLLHKVKTTDALKALGAEHYMDSVILGDCAYTVQQGFLADAHAVRRAAGEAQPRPAPAAPAVIPPVVPKPADAAPKKGGDNDLLAQFLLDNLS